MHTTQSNARARTHTQTHTHTYTCILWQWDWRKGFRKKKGRFKRTDRGGMMDRNRELVPDRYQQHQHTRELTSACRPAEEAVGSGRVPAADCQLCYGCQTDHSAWQAQCTPEKTKFYKLFFTSVQFNSRWYLCAQKSPYALHPVFQKFP